MTDTTFRIRPAAAADAAAEADVIRRAFAAGPYGHRPPTPARQAFVSDAAGRAASGTVLVATDAAGHVVGSASVLRAETRYARVARPGEAEIRLLAVDPSWQTGGIGVALLRAALEVALEWGADALTLDTGTLNTRAQALYERLGFERAPDRDGPAAATGTVPLVYVFPLQERADVRVRLMRAEETDAVAALSERAYAHDYPIGDGYRAAIRAVGERAAESQVWVAEDAASAALVGTVSTPRSGRAISQLAGVGELDFRFLAVDPAARRRGIGQLLARHVLLLGRIRGVDRVVLNSGPEMLAAHRLYEGLGFRRVPGRDATITRADGTSFGILAFALDLAG